MGTTNLTVNLPYLAITLVIICDNALTSAQITFFLPSTLLDVQDSIIYTR